MIKSFRRGRTARVFARHFVSGLPRDVQLTAYRKLLQIDAARTLEDLRVPPGNRLQALTGKRRGQHSIRVNRQWRICFVWRAGNAYQVELTDYH